MFKADTVVILPAHNEAAAIGKVVDSIPYLCVVSASGCSDRTEQIAKEHGATVIRSPKGKGRAIAYAMREVEANKVVMLDADATYPVDFIRPMLDMLTYYDVVVGIRELGIQSSIDRWGNNFITRQAQLLYGLPIHDLCNGMWAFRGDVARALDIQSYGFTLEAELFTNVVRNHYQLGQITIPYYPRVGEKKINRWDHLRIMWYLWSRRFSQ